jgi:hypothetical protein
MYMINVMHLLHNVILLIIVVIVVIVIHLYFCLSHPPLLGSLAVEQRIKLHVVHTNKTKIPDMPKIKGTITFHKAAAERDPNTDNTNKWKLVSRACHVLACPVMVRTQIHACMTRGSPLGL